MSDQIKIACANCIYWKSQHCENFSSKWFGMITSKSQNCGQFKAKKIKKTQENNKEK